MLMTKLDHQSHMVVELKEFKDNFDIFKKEFSEIPFKKFIINHIRLERTSIDLMERLNELEVKNIQLSNTAKEKINEVSSLKTEMNKKSYEDSRRYEILLKQSNNENLGIKEENYKDSYIELSNRISSLYSKWTDIIPLYADDKVFKGKLESPLQLIDLLERIILTRTPSHLQNVLRQIIVSANLLGKKVLGVNYGNSINPEEIYTQVTTKLKEQKSVIIELNSKIRFLKQSNEGLKGNTRVCVNCKYNPSERLVTR